MNAAHIPVNWQRLRHTVWVLNIEMAHRTLEKMHLGCTVIERDGVVVGDAWGNDEG